MKKAKFKNVMSKSKNKQQGQVLLIVILISTVLLTVGLSMLNLTRDDTKLSELEEESKRAFAAAEAGIDAAIHLTPGASVNISNLGLGSDIGGSAIINTTTSNTFTTSTIQKDGQYTFYLTGFNPNTGQLIENNFTDSIRISRALPAGSYCGTSEEFAVELTFINGDGTIVARRLIDECDLIAGQANEEVDFGVAINTNSFSNDPHLMFTRIIAPNATFTGASLVIYNLNQNWPIQGKTITSTAQTGAGVAKKVQLFQSYPQIPAEFFVTSF